MPNKFYSYYKLMRIGNPTGYLLAFFPAVFGILLAANSWYDLRILPLFFIATVLSRGAGCIINDITDRKLDRYVERTKKRPLASGEVSLKEVLVLLYLMLFACLTILLSLTITAIMIGFITFCFTLVYPLMKRLTYFPQVFLGMTFNLGALIGYSAIEDDVSLYSLLIYAGCCFWTIGYDTIYAFMDIADDKKIGIKSTAVFFEKKSYRMWIMIFYMVFVILFANVNLMNSHYIATLAALAVIPIFMWQVRTLDINIPKNCSARFKNNNIVGAILAISMFLDFLYKLMS